MALADSSVRTEPDTECTPHAGSYTRCETDEGASYLGRKACQPRGAQGAF